MAFALGFVALSLSYPTSAALADVDDPTLSQTFASPGEIGASSLLTYTLTNVVGDPAQTGLEFTNTLPVGLAVGSSPAPFTDCPLAGGWLTAAPGSDEVSFAGAMDMGQASCRIEVAVVGDAAQTYSNPATAFSVVNLNAPEPADFIVQSNWGNCPTDALLFQSDDPQIPTNSDLYYVSLVTGERTASVELPAYLNALGYNPLDNYVWGWNQVTNTLTRVGSDLSVVDFPDLADSGGTPFVAPESGFNIGDVDSSGVLTLGRVPGNFRFVRIDLTGSVPVVITDTLKNLSPASMADWAYLPDADSGGRGEGFYGIGISGGSYYLYKTQLNGATTQLDQLSRFNAGESYDDEQGSFGAAYADASGYLYFGNNQSGNIFRVSLAGLTASVAKFSPGPTSAGNDGARCASSPLATDFGDLPDSYRTTLESNGPRSGVDDTLRIGATNTIEPDGIPGEDANSDSGDDGVDGGAGFGGNFTMIPGVDKSVTVTVTNTSGVNVTLAGWIDVDADGSFEASELQTQIIGQGIDQEATLGFPVPSEFTGHTYARFRLVPSNGSVTATSPHEFGETEDYRVDQGAPTNRFILEARVIYRALPGDQFTLTATGGGLQAPGNTTTTFNPYAGTQQATVTVDGIVGTPYTLTQTPAGTTVLADYNVRYRCFDWETETILMVGDGNELSFTPQAGQDVSCTFINTPIVPTITLHKDVSDRVLPGDQFTLTVAGGPTGQVLSGPTTTATTSGSATGVQTQQVGPLNVAQHSSYTFSETPAGSTVLGNYTTTYECVDNGHGGVVVASGQATTFSYTPLAAQQIVCTFNNVSRSPRVTVVTDVESRSLPTDQFTLTVAGGDLVGETATTDGTAAGVQLNRVGAVTLAAGTTYTFTQTGSGATDLRDYSTTYECLDAADGGLEVAAGSSNQFTYTPDWDQSIVCTFTNTATPPTFILEARVMGRALPGDQFTLTATGGALQAPNNTTTTNNTYAGTQQANVAVTGAMGTTYTLTQTAAATTVLANYSVRYQCFDWTNETVLFTGAGNQLTYTTAPGRDVSCTFINTPIAPTVTLQTDVIARVSVSDQFVLAIAGGPTGQILSGPTTTTTTSGSTTGLQSQLVGELSVVQNATYTFSESATAGADLDDYVVTFACTDSAHGDVAVASGSGTTFSYTPTAAQVVVCEFTNTPVVTDVTPQPEPKPDAALAHPPLASTGSSPAPTAALGLSTLAVGAALLLVAMRRRVRKL